MEVTFNQDDRKQSVGMTLILHLKVFLSELNRITGIETPDGNDVSFDQPDNDECTRNILQAAQEDLCLVTVTGINGNDDDDGEAGLSLPGAAELLGTGINTETIRILSEADEFSDPPFKICQEFRTPLGNVEEDTPAINDFVVVGTPSSAEYTIDGRISLQNLHDMLKKYSSVVEIRIINDLHQTDNFPINDITSSKYKGEIVFFKDGIEVNTLPFNIAKINTDCTFITLIEAIKPLGKDGDIASLNEEGAEQFKGLGHFDADNINTKFLVGLQHW